MKDIVTVGRFIDDGAGFYTGTSRQFKCWISTINNSLAHYGLNIDEFIIKDQGQFIPFLDVQFCLMILVISKQICLLRKRMPVLI